MSRYELIQKELCHDPKTWLITGVAGFIGSNLLEKLLGLNQKVVGLDNYATGYKRNLEQVQKEVSREQWSRFRLVKGDITDYQNCVDCMVNIDYVLHQAALGSVPRSIEDPIRTNASNISGYLNVLHAAKEEGVSAFVYAASSSTYGDHEALPKLEEVIGAPLSPYAVTKYVNELYADIYSRVYGFNAIGLRYFNVFGKRQDPDGAYAAVIPKWASSIIEGQNIVINGDGETSRDFCYIDNVVQANILAATSKINSSQVYNIAVGERASLNELYGEIDRLVRKLGYMNNKRPKYAPFREGDVRHSQASIEKAKAELGYQPTHTMKEGLADAIEWYARNHYEK